ncbi:MAG: cation-transporting P-type ATPase [Acidimicrobiales bacterium]
MSLGAQEALAALGSSRRGLDEDGVPARRAASGRNVLPPPRRRAVAAEVARWTGSTACSTIPTSSPKAASGTARH